MLLHLCTTPTYTVSLNFLHLENKISIFKLSDTITFTTGSSGIYPSFKGTIASLSLGCTAQELNNGARSNNHILPYSSESKLKGLWYFDENTLPRPNLANPFNIEPKFYGHSTDLPIWDAILNRWRIQNGSKVVLEIGNFIDFRPTELVRTFSLAIDFRLMTPLSGLITDQVSWTQIGTLSSDIEIALMFRLYSGKYELNLAYLKTDNTWVNAEFGGNNLTSKTELNLDFVWVVSVTRSLINPMEILLSWSRS